MDKEFEIYDNKLFTRYINSKNRTDSVYFTGWFNSKKIRLHTYKYEKEVGEIPKGYHIHHKDGNPSNNEISNLECLSPKEHTDRHFTEERRQLHTKILEEKARPKASIWHRSEKGIEWHKEHAKTTLITEKRDIQCEACGAIKTTHTIVKVRWCSARCKNRINARRYRANKKKGL
jgi:hypothetical protein